MQNHDVIVIGASAGGVDVLVKLVAELPAGLRAAVFVVVHTPPTQANLLPELLNRAARVKSIHPLHGDSIEPGRLYVAPPDSHLLVRLGRIEVVRGPKENGHRPSVDALFRTASTAYGPRVIGVVLSGYQDDGTAGLLSVKARGGLAVVQAPQTAAVPEMPASAIASVAVDHVAGPLELPGLLVRLANSPAGPPLAPGETVAQLEGDALGRPAVLVCPLCQGVLTETAVGVYEHFRCHVGHAFSLRTLVDAQTEEMERALWAAKRSLEEGASLSDRIAATEKNADIRKRFTEKHQTLMRHAEVIRQLLLGGIHLTEPPETRPAVKR